MSVVLVVVDVTFCPHGKGSAAHFRCQPKQSTIVLGTKEEITVAEKEIIFLVEEAPEGGYTAKSLGESIFTEADDIEELKASTRDAVKCHFEDDDAPSIIRLHFVKDEVIAV